MSGGPLRLTLDEEIRALVDAEMEAYFELEIYAKASDAKRSLEGFAQEVREAVEQHNDAAKVRAAINHFAAAERAYEAADHAWAKDPTDPGGKLYDAWDAAGTELLKATDVLKRLAEETP